MKEVAFIFPGQGVQKVGMGKELYDTTPAAKAVFDSAQAIVGGDLLDVIFNGPQEKLTLTSYSQPAIVSCSVAALRALEAHPKFSELKVSFVAGLSLGEYSALIASGAFSLEDGIRLVQKRGTFMDEACKLEKGSMAAIIGFPKDRLKEICSQTGAQVANFNSSEQIVITGHAEKVQAAVAAIEKENPKNIVMLEVAGGFHSSLMKPAADKFSAELAKFTINPPRIPLVGNVEGVAETRPDTIRKNLPLQITSSVLWENSIRFVAGQGVKHFIEIGPGKVLKGLIRRIDPSLTVYNVEKPSDVDAVFSS